MKPTPDFVLALAIQTGILSRRSRGRWHNVRSASGALQRVIPSDRRGTSVARRGVLGEGDADPEVMAVFGRVCRLHCDDWKHVPLDKIPRPATWLRRPEWEHLEILASMPRMKPEPPRPHYVIQADLNAATGKLVL